MGGRVNAFDVIRGGLADAVVKPIANDWKDAYHLQRAARVRYPGADAVLNVTPYLGIATVADDIANDVAEAGSVSGENLAEAALNRSTVGGYAKYAPKVAKKAVDVTKKAAQFTDEIVRDVQRSSRGKRGNAAAAHSMITVPAAAGGALLVNEVAQLPVKYVEHYANKQAEADAKYGARPLRDIAMELKALKARQRGSED